MPNNEYDALLKRNKQLQNELQDTLAKEYELATRNVCLATALVNCLKTLDEMQMVVRTPDDNLRWRDNGEVILSESSKLNWKPTPNE